MADNFSSQILRGDLGGALIPDEISQEIIQTLPQSSVLLTRARRVPMSSKKKTQPVLASLPEAYWVSEGGLKQTSKTGWEDVQITAEELAVIVPIPDSVVDDAKINLWDTVKPLIAEAMGKKIDQAGIFGVDKPSTWGNDILAGATAAGTNVASGTGVDLADDIAMIGQKLSEKGFAVNGFASQPGLNWQLARLRDANGQPIYTPSVAAGNPASLYGYPLNEVANGAWDTTKAMLLAADWTKSWSACVRTSPTRSSTRASSPTPRATWCTTSCSRTRRPCAWSCASASPSPTRSPASRPREASIRPASSPPPPLGRRSSDDRQTGQVRHQRRTV